MIPDILEKARHEFSCILLVTKKRCLGLVEMRRHPYVLWNVLVLEKVQLEPLDGLLLVGYPKAPSDCLIVITESKLRWDLFHV